MRDNVSLVRTIVESKTPPENHYVYWYDVNSDAFKRYDKGEWVEFNVRVRNDINSLYKELNEEIGTRDEADTQINITINNLSDRTSNLESSVRTITLDLDEKADEESLQREIIRATTRENEIESKIPDITGKVDIEALQNEITRAKQREDEIATSIPDISGKADIGDSYTKEESDDAFQPKGNYLTEHQSLDNYYTKPEAEERFLSPDELGYVTMEMIGSLE